MTADVDPIEQASGLLDAGSGREIRMACWIARIALERDLRAFLAASGRPAPSASARSLFSIFQAAPSAAEDLLPQVQFAWDALSRLSHHHAYELTPSAREARQVVAIVENFHNAIGALL